MSDPTELHYRLGRSVVRASGTVSCIEDSVDRSSKRSNTASVTVVAEADPDLELQLRATEDLFKDRDLELKFADDGRLLSANSTETGVGAALVEAGVRVATGVVALAVRVAGGVAETVARAEEGEGEGAPVGEEPAPDPVAAAYADADPDSAALRERLKNAVGALTTALADLGSDIAEAKTGKEEKELVARYHAVQTTLAATRDEAAKMEARFDAWRATTKTTTTSDYAFALVTDDLLEAADLDELTLETDKLPPRLQAVAASLNLIVAKTADPDRPPLFRTDIEEQRQEGVYVRLPRPMVLSVYSTTDDRDTKPRRYTRTSRQVVSVVDEHSAVDFLSFDSHLFGKHVAGIELSASGAVSKISSSATAPAGEAARAVSAGIGQMQDTLDQAVKMSEALSKLRSAADTDRLAALKRKKEELETTIAEKGLVASEGDLEQLAAVKAETDLVEARKQLAADMAPPPAPTEIQQLRDELEKAKVELELRHVQLELAHSGSDGS